MSSPKNQKHLLIGLICHVSSAIGELGELLASLLQPHMHLVHCRHGGSNSPISLLGLVRRLDCCRRGGCRAEELLFPLRRLKTWASCIRMWIIIIVWSRVKRLRIWLGLNRIDGCFSIRKLLFEQQTIVTTVACPHLPFNWWGLQIHSIKINSGKQIPLGIYNAQRTII